MGYDVALTVSMTNTLWSLQQIDSASQDVNYRLATGKKVNSALDDPVAYFAAQDHSYRSSDLTNRKDEINEAIQLVTAANSGVESILDLIDSAESLANAALVAEDQAEINNLEEEYNEVLTQIDQLASDGFYKGTNLLGGNTETLEVAFNADGSSTITLTGEDASSTGLGLAALTTDDWSDGTDPDTPDKTNIDATMDLLDAAKGTLRSMAQSLSMDLSTMEIRLDFAGEMINTLETGVTNLVTADTNEESANLLMLQTQQELSINALSISSDQYQSVLGLFN